MKGQTIVDTCWQLQMSYKKTPGEGAAPRLSAFPHIKTLACFTVRAWFHHSEVPYLAQQCVGSVLKVSWHTGTLLCFPHTIQEMWPENLTVLKEQITVELTFIHIHSPCCIATDICIRLNQFYVESKSSIQVVGQIELKSVRLKIHVKDLWFSVQRFQKSWNAFLGSF